MSHEGRRLQTQSGVREREGESEEERGDVKGAQGHDTEGKHLFNVHKWRGDGDGEERKNHERREKLIMKSDTHTHTRGKRGSSLSEPRLDGHVSLTTLPRRDDEFS